MCSVKFTHWEVVDQDTRVAAKHTISGRIHYALIVGGIYLRSVGQMHFLIAFPVLVLEVPGCEQETITWPTSRREREAIVPGAKASYGVAIAVAARVRSATKVVEIMLRVEVWCLRCEVDSVS